MSASTIAGPSEPAAAGLRARMSVRELPVSWVVVAALTVLAAVIRFFYIGHQGFWFDEGNTALLVRLSPGQMLGLIRQSESTPPLYYCIAWLWVRVFGDAEAGLRSLSALAGVLTVPVAYGAAARLVSRRAGLIACALTACSPLLIWYSQEARSYELLVLFTSLALLFFAHARLDPTPRALTAWVVCCALAFATHYYAVVAVLPQAGWLLWEHRRLRRVQVAVALALLCGAALLPLAIKQNGTGRDSWIPHSPFGLRIAQVIPQFLIGTGAPARKVLKWLAFVLAGIALLRLALARREELVRKGGVVAAGLALSGFVLTLLLAAVGKDFLITRNILALWLPAAICVSAGLASIGSPSRDRANIRPQARAFAGPAVAVALCGIGLAAAIGIDADYSLQRPNWRPVARALGAPPPIGQDRVILIQHYRTLLPLSLYMPHLAFLRGSRVVAHGVRELDVISIRSPQQPLCWWGAACNLIPSQMQQTYRIEGFHVVSRRQVEQFTILTMRADRPVDVTPAEVSATLRTTTLHNDDLLVQRS